MIILKSPPEIEKMREAGKLVRAALEKAQEVLKPGMTTGELDRIVEEFILQHGARPAFKGYQGFPASICASINDEVVHGIPGKRRIEDGDIVGIDVGVIYQGFYGDAAVTLPAGKISAEAQELLNVTEQALYRGIEKAVPGNYLTDISHAIQTFVESKGYSVVRKYVGHGIGREMHEDPQVPNFGKPHQGPLLKEGMTLAIEPMVNVGGYEVFVMPDNWTVKTKDGSLSAHFEHTVALTKDGPQILTL